MPSSARKSAQPTTKSAAEAIAVGDHSGQWDGRTDFDDLPTTTPPQTQQVVPATPVTPEPSIGVVTAQIVSPDEAVQTLMDWCVEYYESQEEDENAVMAREIARILAGENAVDVLSERTPIQGKEYPWRPFMLHGFMLTKTDFSEGWPFYASMDTTARGGSEHFVINCGGPKVMATLMRLEQIGEYPYYVQINAKPTKQGFTVLDLVDGSLDLAPRG